MCTQRSPRNWSRELYQRHGETIDRYLTTKVLPAIRENNGKGGSILLKELQHRWINHQIMNKWLKRFFTYLDRYHIKHHSFPTLHEVGLKCFRSKIYEEVKSDTTAAILSLVHDEREGRIIDTLLVKCIVDIYECMGMGTLETYVADIEQPLLENTREFYAQKREAWMNYSTSDYLIKAENALKAESARVADYFNSSSESKILRVVEKEILESLATALIEKESSGCRALLEKDMSEDLHRMFTLFNRLEDGLVPIAQIFQMFLISTGDGILTRRHARLNGGEKDTNEDTKFIKSMIELHVKYLGVVKKEFVGHVLFQKALKDAFVEIINKDVGKFTNAELMSSYCDRVLRSGGEKLNDQEIEESIEQIAQLFSYLTDKDLFAEVYRNQLAKRLLTQRSASGDLEKLMVAKLKVQCGTQFTARMEGMLTDLAIGGEMRTEFERSARQAKLEIEFSVQVLTYGHWPSTPVANVTVTDKMQKCLKHFEVWHANKLQGRRLQWVFRHGNANVQATFGKKTYDLQVSTLQAIVLDAMNGGATIGFTTLATRLALDESTLKQLLHSLSCGKHKVITKLPAGKSVRTTDEFVANVKFTSKERKFRIPVPVGLLEVSSESAASKAKVHEERKHVYEAAIVRIMKTRKTLPHQQLLSEVLALPLNFKAEPREIKKHIGFLIDREYMERSSENATIYNYLA
jgi:cullin 1